MNSHFFYVLMMTSLLSLLLASGCKKEDQSLHAILKKSIDTKVNPYSKVPLGALLTFETKKPSIVEFTVQGKIPVTRSFSTYRRSHSIPVTGLYADTTNQVSLKISDKKGKIYTGMVEIATAEIPHLLPEIDIVQLDRSRMEPGFHLSELLIANNGLFHSYTIMLST